MANYTYTNDQNRYLSRLDYGNADSVQYTYDDLSRVVLETYEDGSTVAYAYDNNGALATVTDSETGIKTTYYYDFTDRLMKYVEKGTGYSHSVGYEYDTLNNLTKLVETINGVDHTTEYTYDEDNRVTGVTSNGVSHAVEYDAFGRLYRVSTNNSAIRKTYSYTANSAQVSGVQISADMRGFNWQYTYDDNGNITYVNDRRNSGHTYYTYDSANQLIREDNSKAGKTWTWEYDDAGNILSKKEYAYTTGVLGTPTDTITYAYTDASWGDLLTSYDGTTLHYDAIGNLAYDGEWAYAWQHGRQLQSMYDGTQEVSFTYDANGMRKTKNTGSWTYTYTYNGSQLTQMTFLTSEVFYFTYDPQGHPATVKWNNHVYYYITNLQGDVIAIADQGVVVVEYKYDAWGKLLSITGSEAQMMGRLNPLRYRGYVYDQETGLYYLQSRYYNPEWGRFLNADALVATGQGMLGNNMFAYCGNNPSNCVDPSGTITAICHGDDVDMISMPWQDVGPAGGYRNVKKYSSIYTKTHGLIYDQETFEFSNATFGKGTMASSGCAIIAVYNAMILLGKHHSLGKIRDEFLRKLRTIGNGKYGVAPWQYKKYFSDHGLSYAGFSSASELEKTVSSGDIIVFTPMNNWLDPSEGFHTMAAKYINGTFWVYNGYGCGCSQAQHLSDLHEGARWIYGYIVVG